MNQSIYKLDAQDAFVSTRTKYSTSKERLQWVELDIPQQFKNVHEPELAELIQHAKESAAEARKSISQSPTVSQPTSASASSTNFPNSWCWDMCSNQYLKGHKHFEMLKEYRVMWAIFMSIEQVKLNQTSKAKGKKKLRKKKKTVQHERLGKMLYIDTEARKLYTDGHPHNIDHAECRFDMILERFHPNTKGVMKNIAMNKMNAQLNNQVPGCIQAWLARERQKTPREKQAAAHEEWLKKKLANKFFGYLARCEGKFLYYNPKN